MSYVYLSIEITTTERIIKHKLSMQCSNQRDMRHTRQSLIGVFLYGNATRKQTQDETITTQKEREKEKEKGK